MLVTPGPTEVRGIVDKVLGRLGETPAAIDDLAETILIDEGKCFSRSYRSDNYMAQWLIDVGILQIYDMDGNMIQTVNLFTQRRPIGAAAA